MNRTNGKSRAMTRRQFVRNTVYAGLVGAAAPLWSACGDGTKSTTSTTKTLNILMWTHFVPNYDAYFAAFTQQWGRDNGIDVQITHVPVDQIAAHATEHFDDFDIIETTALAAAFEPRATDLGALVAELESRYGPQSVIGKATCYNPTTSKYFGVCHGYVPNPMVFRQSLWTAAGGADGGPATLDDLLTVGAALKTDSLPLGLGFAFDADSAVTLHSLLWTFGGAVQDINRNVAIDSDATRAALAYARDLYAQASHPDTANPAVWSTSSVNNVRYLNGEFSLISNPISVYRRALANPDTKALADDSFLAPPPAGPDGTTGFTPPNIALTYVLPASSRRVRDSQDLIRALLADYANGFAAAQLYTLPAFPGAAPDIEAQFENDPPSTPPDKLSMLYSASDWVRAHGYPGSANAAVQEVYDAQIVNQMFNDFVTGQKDADTVVSEAEAAMVPIFAKWRSRGYI